MSETLSNASGPPASTAAGSPVRVLIADDHPDTAESLATLLSAAGFATQIARDGEDALRCALAWCPQVFVLDLRMPKLDGIDIARAIRRQSSTPPPILIALTGWGRADDKRRVREAGFDYHLLKPADPQEVLRVIRTAADRKLIGGTTRPVR